MKNSTIELSQRIFVQCWFLATRRKLDWDSWRKPSASPSILTWPVLDALNVVKSFTRFLRKKPQALFRPKASNSTIDSGGVAMLRVGRRIGSEATGNRSVTLWKRLER